MFCSPALLATKIQNTYETDRKCQPTPSPPFLSSPLRKSTTILTCPPPFPSNLDLPGFSFHSSPPRPSPPHFPRYYHHCSPPLLVFSRCTRHSSSMIPAATRYAVPASTCGPRYGCAVSGRRSLSAMTSETSYVSAQPSGITIQEARSTPREN